MRDKKGKFKKGHEKIEGTGAPIGNENAVKLKTSKVKKEAYRQYCEYISTGGTKGAWYFEHPEITLTSETMDKYIEEDPIEFPPIHKTIAESKSYEHWLNLGKDMMLGKVEKCQPAIYQMFMRNKFKWDKDDVEVVAKCAAEKIWEHIKNDL